MVNLIKQDHQSWDPTEILTIPICSFFFVTNQFLLDAEVLDIDAWAAHLKIMGHILEYVTDHVSPGLEFFESLERLIQRIRSRIIYARPDCECMPATQGHVAAERIFDLYLRSKLSYYEDFVFAQKLFAPLRGLLAADISRDERLEAFREWLGDAASLTLYRCRDLVHHIRPIFKSFLDKSKLTDEEKKELDSIFDENFEQMNLNVRAQQNSILDSEANSKPQ